MSENADLNFSRASCEVHVVIPIVMSNMIVVYWKLLCVVRCLLT